MINLRNKHHFKFHPSTISTSHRLRPRTHVFNSFFYTCLTRSASEYDYAIVTNWPNRSGFTVKDMDLILIPINKHWVLASIDLRTQTFSFMDPMKKERDRLFRDTEAVAHTRNSSEEWKGMREKDEYR